MHGKFRLSVAVYTERAHGPPVHICFDLSFALSAPGVGPTSSGCVSVQMLYKIRSSAKFVFTQEDEKPGVVFISSLPVSSIINLSSTLNNAPNLSDHRL